MAAAAIGRVRQSSSGWIDIGAVTCPFEGLPDPAKHRVCMRCSKWFEADEGALAVKEGFGLSGAIADGIRNSAGDADLHFICDRCASVRRRRKYALYGVLALALAWAAIKEAGWL